MEITVKGNKITLKKDYLTNGEVNYIVGEVLKIYNQEGDIDGYSYSPLAMITNFYALLFRPDFAKYFWAGKTSSVIYSIDCNCPLSWIFPFRNSCSKILFKTAA